MTKYKCADCGGKIRLNQKYCEDCGSELVWGNEEKKENKSFIDSIIESIIPFKEMSKEDVRRYEDRKWLAHKMRWTGLNGIVSILFAIGFFVFCIVFFIAIFA